MIMFNLDHFKWQFLKIISNYTLDFFKVFDILKLKNFSKKIKKFEHL